MTDQGAQPSVRSPWILSTFRDLGLFVATPLLILPLYAIVQLGVRPEAIALYVAAFGALGHHLPGMMRAYGDRALFARFKTRFIAAPVFLGVACVASAHWDLTVLSIVAIVWGVWHGLMQTYGFARIYDGKRGSFSRLASWLDFLLCITWFGAGVFFSPARFHTLADKFFVQCGAPLVPASWLTIFLDGWAALTVAVTTVYVIHVVHRLLKGEPVSGVKLLLFATSFAFWWYTHVTVQNVLVGVALFEVFHDVQYLSIVWVFNRSRVDRDPSVGGFTRFVFRRSGALIGVYVGMVFAYGSLALINNGYSMSTIHGGFQGLLIGSGLLHFYYDGFIWKIRESSTRQSLGIADGAAGGSRINVPWLAHGLKWAAFVVPAVLLGWSDWRNSDGDRFSRTEWLAQALPLSAPAQASWGEALMDAGRIDDAAEAFSASLRLDDRSSETHNNAGIVFGQQGDAARAMSHFQRAVELDPYNADARTSLGFALASQGEWTLAIAQYRKALEAEPSHAIASENLELALKRWQKDEADRLNQAGIMRARQGQPLEAIDAFQRVLAMDSENVAAHNNLGIVLSGLGRTEEALAHYNRSLAIQPDSPQTHVNLGALYASLGKLPEAIAYYDEAVRLKPDDPSIRNRYGEALAHHGLTDEAVAQFQAALSIDPAFEPARRNKQRYKSSATQP